jgi:hypothetical protein
MVSDVAEYSQRACEMQEMRQMWLEGGEPTEPCRWNGRKG